MPNLEDALLRLVGAECWAVVAGAGNGSRMTIHLGRKTPRATPILSAQEPIKTFQGEFCLFIENCAWRLQDSASFLCVWNQPEDVVGKATQVMAGTKVTSVKLLTTAGDLHVEFDGRYALTVFCDQMLDADAMDNYSLRISGLWYTIAGGGTLSVSESKAR